MAQNITPNFDYVAIVCGYADRLLNKHHDDITEDPNETLQGIREYYKNSTPEFYKTTKSTRHTAKTALRSAGALIVDGVVVNEKIVAKNPSVKDYYFSGARLTAAITGDLTPDFLFYGMPISAALRIVNWLKDLDFCRIFCIDDIRIHKFQDQTILLIHLDTESG